METSQSSTLELNYNFARKILVNFLRDEIRQAGFSKAVIGLSGGVDSALATELAVEALGKKNVFAVLMPYKTSNPESRVDAECVVKKLGIHSEVIEITPMVEPYIEQYKITNNVRKGNIMARQRMTVLYDISARERALVVGTSNKTELLLGYGTLFGDMASALNPLGDLYKTQIWQLAEVVGVPQKIIDKKPTADLWQGQTDESDLGFSYKEVDRLLYFLVDERRDDQELIKLGFERKFIDTVKKKIQSNQFKRCLPLIAKISHRTINVDFRYIRDWGV